MQQKLEVAAEYASSHAEVEQERYKKYQNLRSADKHFEVGQQVLVLIPDTTASKLFSKCKGPATVVAVRSPYSYEVNDDCVPLKSLRTYELFDLRIICANITYELSLFCMIHLCISLALMMNV